MGVFDRSKLVGAACGSASRKVATSWRLEKQIDRSQTHLGQLARQALVLLHEIIDEFRLFLQHSIDRWTCWGWGQS